MENSIVNFDIGEKSRMKGSATGQLMGSSPHAATVLPLTVFLGSGAFRQVDRCLPRSKLRHKLCP